MINNSVLDSAEVSEHVLDAFLIRLEDVFKINIRHDVSLPIGAGFGTSGAAALGLALALNEAFGLGMSRIEAAQIAHIAEIECKTGLGTVIAETFGGLEIRVKPGAPGIGKIRKVPILKEHIIACLNFNSLPTKKFLTDKETRRHINKAGEKFVAGLVENPEVKNFMKFSRQFAEQVGVITEKVREVLDATDKTGFVCSMPMFGESVFTLIERESLPEILKIFGRFDTEGKVVVSEIDFEGARLLK
jgi:pantoate kinase